MKKFILILIMLSAGGACFAQSGSTSEFRMLRSNLISGLIPDISDGYGVTFRDINNDSYPDVYLVCFRNLNRLLINNGGIIPFIDRTVYSGLGGYLMPRGQTNLELGSSAADYDNDGNPDIFLSGWGKTSRLFKNMGDVYFRDVTENLNLNFIMDANQGLWTDVNGDHYLDLYITDNVQSNRLFLNLKNGDFEEKLWAVEFTDAASSHGVCSADFDQDGDMDLYVANWNAADYLLQNTGEGSFIKLKLPLPTLNEESSSNSACVGDIDNDGDLDLIVSQLSGKIFYYENLSTDSVLVFRNKIEFGVHNLSGDVYGALLEDFNNDGWLDCFLSIRGQNRLYLNNTQGIFKTEYDTDERDIYSTGSACADLDKDGDLDIFVSNKNSLSEIYLNPTNDQNSVTLNIQGIKSNRDAVGTRVFFYDVSADRQKLLGLREVKNHSGYLSSSDLPVHFGMGNDTLVSAEVIYPSGIIVRLENLKRGEFVEVSEYGRLEGELYLFWKTTKYYLSLPVFWGNLILFILYLILFLVFIMTGIRRYQWEIGSMATRLIIWFTMSLGIFLIWRTDDLQFILIILNAVFLVAVSGSVSYSEYILSLKQRRLHFRSSLETLSKEMINIHDNKELFRRLSKPIALHAEINNVIAGLKSDRENFEWYPLSSEGESHKLRLSLQDQKLISASQWLVDEKDNFFPEVLRRLNANVLIPVKTDYTLLAFIGLQMPDYASPLNQNDLRFIMTIANQIAIAIQNNKYLKESEAMVKKLTEAQVREKYLKELEKTNQELDNKNGELTRLFSELQQKESQLIHSEKMASLGQLVAGISHELNNPVSFIYANSKALQKYLEELEHLVNNIQQEKDTKATLLEFDEIIRDIKEIVTDNLSGSESVKQLVIDLKNFSRLDQAERKNASLSSGMESSLRMLHTQMKDEITVIKNYVDDPPIYCNPGQLNQVFINILSNAVQAMNGKGQIEITLQKENKDWLMVRIGDNGKGINDINLKKIFDPFFTTKDVNEGAGLGLSISHTIIEKHGGKIEVKSEENKGTVFTIFLPLNKGNPN